MNIDKIQMLSSPRESLNKMPDIDTVSYTSDEVSTWAGKTHGLIKNYNVTDAISFQVKSDFLGFDSFRKQNWSQMRTIIISIISSLELELPYKYSQLYAAGETYNFYRDLKEILHTAELSIFLVDPYIDNELFDLYIDSIPENVQISLLTKSVKDTLHKIIDKYKENESARLEVKVSQGIHDRLAIVDNKFCWLIGQSIKDAAKKYPTYIVPLMNELVEKKYEYYQKIWHESELI